MDYSSRFYSPRLGRFTQPDTIVPGMGSQSFNRYSYVFNNPIMMIDPSRHDPICMDFDLCFTDDTEENADNLTDYFLSIMEDGQEDETLEIVARINLHSFGAKDDVEAFARLVEAADEIYAENDDWSFWNGLSMVIAGTIFNYASGYYAWADNTNSCRFSVGKCDGRDNNLRTFEDKGYKSEYADDSNQMFHIFPAIASAATRPVMGYISSKLAMFVHEEIDLIRAQLDPDFNPGGASKEDKMATDAGIVIGWGYSQGAVGRSELGNIIRLFFGDEDR